jgi:hypothetical protein
VWARLFLEVPTWSHLAYKRLGNSFISLPFPHNALLESPISLASCRQFRRPCSIKFLFCQPSGSLRCRNPFEQSRFSNSQCEEVVHRVFVLGPCFKSSESNKEVRPGSIEACCYASLVVITNVKRGTLIFSHHADSLDRWAPSSSVSRPYDAMTSLYPRFPQPYSRRRDRMSWPCWAPCCLHPIPDWVNWPLLPRSDYKMEPFTGTADTKAPFPSEIDIITVLVLLLASLATCH